MAWYIQGAGDRRRALKSIVVVAAISGGVADCCLAAEPEPRATAASGVALDLQPDAIVRTSESKGHLARELVRQALLVAARDELGLPTRDAVLGEPLPGEEAPEALVLHLSQMNQQRRFCDVTVSLRREGTFAKHSVISFEVPEPEAEFLEQLAARAEALSTGEFVSLLKELGCSGRSHEFAPDGPVAGATRDKLNRLDLLSQYSTLRGLHQEIAEQGESPERLDALARGYALLATLAEHLPNTAYKACGARALIYAERLRRLAPESALSLRTRAFVRALVGLHTAALADLADAEKQNPAADTPGWIPAVDAFCRNDRKKLAELAEAAPADVWPVYLEMLLASPSPDYSRRLQAAAKVLAIQPSCERAFDVCTADAPLGAYRQGIAAALAGFAQTLAAELPKMAGLPESVGKLATKVGEDQAAQMLVRAELIGALRSSGQIGSDRHEPSWALLAALIHEESFRLGWLELDLERFNLGVDPTATLEAFRPIAKGHYFALVAEGHAWDHREANKALSALTPVLGRDMRLINLSTMPVNGTLRHYFASWYNSTWYGDRAADNADEVYSDLARVVHRSNAKDKNKAAAARALRRVSPRSEYGVAGGIRFDWDDVRDEIDGWQRDYADSPEVATAFAHSYLARNDFENGERWLKQSLALLPDPEQHEALIDLYWLLGDEPHWIAALENLQKQPCYNLNDVLAGVALADYYLRRGEPEKARPYVEPAARSWATRALVCAARYYEATGKWDRAEFYEKACTERYEGYRTAWYVWCRATGRGDVEGARRYLDGYLEKWKDRPLNDTHFLVAAEHILHERHEEALASLRAAHGVSPATLHLIHEALVADELGQDKLRDELLAESRTTGMAGNWGFVQLALCFERWLAARPDEKTARDTRRLDWAILDTTGAGSPTKQFYLAGKFLTRRGLMADAVRYFRLAATSPCTKCFEVCLAAEALRKLGEPIGERRFTEYDEPTTRYREGIDRGVRLTTKKAFDHAIAAFTKVIADNPDFPEAYVKRAKAYDLSDQFAEAEADLTQAIELLPTCARFIFERALVYEHDGRYADAIDDYRRGIEVAPEQGWSHYQLALLRAACPDEAFRDSALAMEHARKAEELHAAAPHLLLALHAASAAAAGDFEQAVELQKQAVEKSPSDTKKMMEDRLKLYQNGEPYVRKPGWWK